MGFCVFDFISVLVVVAIALAARHFVPGSSPYSPAFYLGFLLIAAYFSGVLLRRFKLPKISGYIAAGIVFGPFGLNIMTAETIGRLRLIDGLALSLIALVAGGELHIESIRKQLKSITLVTMLQLVIVFVGVVLLLWALRDRFALTASQPQEVALAIILLAGVVAVANSPATTIAIINEFKAHGPVANLSLGVTVLKDVVVIILFAIVLSVIKTMIDASATLGFDFLLHLLREISFSLLSGGILGLLIILYLKYIQTDAELFMLLAVFFVADLAPTLQLDGLLLCITAGFIVQNYSQQGKKFFRAIERSVLPVFVLFFAIAGASLDFSSLWRLWFLTLVLAAARLFLVYVSTWSGAWLAGEQSSVKKYGWMGFIAQAGVILGFAILVERAFPAWGGQFKSLVIAMITVNQIIGPILFRYGLFMARETGETLKIK